MLNKLLFYLIIKPFSHLPMPILYGISDFFYLLLISVFPYRKKIILQNIGICFPELSSKEKRRLLRKNYFHLSNILAEGIKNLSISQKRLRKRFVLENPEIFDELYAQGRSVIIASSHYSNWEYLITAQNLLIQQRAIGIGKPLSRKFLNNKINALRERNGMKVVSAKNYKEEIQKRHSNGELVAILALADQRPSIKNAYWSTIFQAQTAFTFGPEYMAHQFDFPVVFLKTRRVKRGYYSSKATVVTLNPQEEEYGVITEKYIALLEAQIREKPEHWLWSHKRWKFQIPQNLNEIQQLHRDFFYQRFGKDSHERNG